MQEHTLIFKNAIAFDLVFKAFYDKHKEHVVKECGYFLSPYDYGVNIYLEHDQFVFKMQKLDVSPVSAKNMMTKAHII